MTDRRDRVAEDLLAWLRRAVKGRRPVKTETWDELAEMLTELDSPLPTDEELCAAFLAGASPKSAHGGKRAVCAYTLRLAQRQASMRADEPGWQLEDFAVELGDLAEEMEGR